MKQTETAGGIVLNNKGLVLVVNQNGTSWSLPKGHVEEGEDKLTAARREIYEESGITDLSLVRGLGTYQRYKIGIDGNDDRSELKTIYMFLFTTNQNELSPIDPDNPEARWVEKEEVGGLLTHPKDSEFFLQYYSDF
jgi:8-oxo-dGTP pyrophosphatase MutT (NUDIX family)